MSLYETSSSPWKTRETWAVLSNIYAGHHSQLMNYNAGIAPSQTVSLEVTQIQSAFDT